MMGISPFYAYYGFYPRLEYEVEADDSSSVLAALERIKRISLERKALAKRWEHAAEA